jgi:hypothetical protein
MNRVPLRRGILRRPGGGDNPRSRGTAIRPPHCGLALAMTLRDMGGVD